MPIEENIEAENMYTSGRDLQHVQASSQHM